MSGTTRPMSRCPWYNTLVWTLFVTPVGFLIFAGTGIWAALRFGRSEPIGPLFVVHWAFLMLLRALPHTPGHDGVRLFLPAFGVLALLGGLRSPIPHRPVGPVGQGSHRPGLDRRNRQLGGDDASAFVVFQPSWWVDYPEQAPWVWSPRITGMHSMGLAPVARDEHAGGRDHSVRHIPALVALPTRYRRITQALSGNRSWATDLVCAPKPAGRLFRRRPGTRCSRSPRLFRHQAGRPVGVDIPLQRV